MPMVSLSSEQDLAPERGGCVKGKESSSPLLGHTGLSLCSAHLKEETRHQRTEE